MKSSFGGVPMGVPFPPMFAAKARPSSSGAAMRGFFRTLKVASATGSMARVVAVFETHIEIAAVAIMNPRIRRFGLSAPTSRMIASATFSCVPVFSIALESMNPPMSRRIR